MLALLFSVGCQQSPDKMAGNSLSSEYSVRKNPFSRLLAETVSVREAPVQNVETVFTCFKEKIVEDNLDPGVVLAILAGFYDAVDRSEALSDEAQANIANTIVLSRKYVRACTSQQPKQPK